MGLGPGLICWEAGPKLEVECGGRGRSLKERGGATGLGVEPDRVGAGLRVWGWSFGERWSVEGVELGARCWPMGWGGGGASWLWAGLWLRAEL